MSLLRRFNKLEDNIGVEFSMEIFSVVTSRNLYEHATFHHLRLYFYRTFREHLAICNSSDLL